jgi:hypothetical protein
MVRPMSSRPRSSPRRLTLRWRIPAPNPPSPRSANRRWMLMPLSGGRGLVLIPIPGLTSLRTSRPSGRVAGSTLQRLRRDLPTLVPHAAYWDNRDTRRSESDYMVRTFGHHRTSSKYFFSVLAIWPAASRIIVTCSINARVAHGWLENRRHCQPARSLIACVFPTRQCRASYFALCPCLRSGLRARNTIINRQCRRRRSIQASIATTDRAASGLPHQVRAETETL